MREIERADDLACDMKNCVTLRPWTGTKGQIHKGRWSDNYIRGVAALAALSHPAYWSLLDQLYIFGDHVE